MFLTRVARGIRTNYPRSGTTDATALFNGGTWEGGDPRTGELTYSPSSSGDNGDVINAERALSFHPWFRALAIISTKVASVPRLMFKRGVNGKQATEVFMHPVLGLLNAKANDEQTAFQWHMQMTGHMVTRGNGYSAIYRAPDGSIELIPMDPDATYPERKGNQLWYVCQPFGYDKAARPIRMKAADVIHYKGVGFDGLVGYPVWYLAAMELNLGRSERKLEAARYKNTGRPSVILQTDMKLGDKVKKRVKSDWEAMVVGLDNAGKTAILDGGLKAQTIAMTARDLEQSQAAQMSIVAISNYTGVPVSKLGGMKLYASQEQETRALIDDCLDWYWTSQDDELRDKLLYPTEPGMYIEADREALLRPDSKAKFENLRTATAGKPFLTQNEAREVIGYQRTDEATADELGTPLNVGMGGAANDPNDPNGEPAGRPAEGANSGD